MIDVRRTLAAADALEADGRRIAAVELLTRANREHRSAPLEERLVVSRNRAFEEMGGGRPGSPTPMPVEPGHAPEDDGMPAVGGGDLTAGRIAGAVQSHGALIVRGLIGAGRVAGLVDGVDRAFAAKEAAEGGAGPAETTPWYVPFTPEGEAAISVALGRGFLSGGSGVWLADSPRMMFALLETFERAGLRRIMTELLGESPALSVNKGTMRRARPDVGTAWWHQDGAFLGNEIRSLNVWLSLSHCGRDAPGLEMVPRRLDRVVECGTRGADFDWSVSDEVVTEVGAGAVARPVFAPGDALLFDHLLLHRTLTDPAMTATRYATETWFFAPSAYPDPVQQVPLVF